MAFSKRFPKDKPGSNFPEWVEVALSLREEKETEERARLENIKLMGRCIEDARAILREKGLKEYQTNIVSTAIALFEKLASHSVYWKEDLCKEKFDRKNN